MNRTLALCATLALTAACKQQTTTIVAAPAGPAADALAPAPPPPSPGGTPTSLPAPTTSTLPAGHPPLQGAPDLSPLPAGHPAPATAVGADSHADEITIQAPAEWAEKPPRPMLYKVWTTPAAEGDAAGGEVTLSFLGAGVPLELNVQRWCGQFGLDELGCKGAARQAPLQGSAMPGTVVELAGTFNGGSMGGQGDGPKAGQKLVVVELVGAEKRWYFKLIGPEKTVDKWKPALQALAAAAKAP